MIILEFRFPENFHAASRILEAHRIPYASDLSTVEWRPSLLYLFAEDLRTDAQREAIQHMRSIEGRDRVQRKLCPDFNLAVPP